MLRSAVLSKLTKPARLACMILCSLCLLPAARAQITGGEEYARIGYTTVPTSNAIDQLSERLESGELRLQYREERGYLDDLLTALGIDPSSQVLVFSPTSLQYPLISAATPRALYFNDEIYIGYVQHSQIVEITTMDPDIGMIFYVFHNAPKPQHFFERMDQRCLVCHDSNGTMGGGIPLLLARSSVYNIEGENLLRVTGEGNISDRTPLADRWGGWYVSGEHGSLRHLGNIRLPKDADAEDYRQYQTPSMDTLADAGFFDTDPYPVATSDILALLILEHQLTVQDQLTYVKFKAPVVLDRIGHGDATTARSWAELPDRAQKALSRMTDRLLDELLLRDAAEFPDTIASTSGYDLWFAEQAIRDSQGRSLRDLDLQQRLFRYRLSYLIHSQDFDALPDYVRDYIFTRLAEILGAEQAEVRFAYLEDSERRAILDILSETKAGFAAYLQ